MSVTSDFIDLSDHDKFVEAVPYEAFAQLRHEDPVHWNPEPDGGRGFWAVTRYEDIRAVHRNTEVFSSETRRHLARGPRARAHRGAQVDDRHGPAAPRRAARAGQPPLHAQGRRRLGGAGPQGRQARCSTRRCPRASSTSCTRSPPRSRCRSSPRSSACRRRSGARSSRSATACSATPTPSTRTTATTTPTATCRSRARRRWTCSRSAGGSPTSAGTARARTS